MQSREAERKSRRSRVNELAKKFEILATNGSNIDNEPPVKARSTSPPSPVRTSSLVNNQEQRPSIKTAFSKSFAYDLLNQIANSEASNIESPTEQEIELYTKRSDVLVATKPSKQRAETYTIQVVPEQFQPIQTEVILSESTERRMKKNEAISGSYDPLNQGEVAESIVMNNSYQVEDDEITASEIIKLKGQLNQMRLDNEMLQDSLHECRQALKQFQSDYKKREKVVNEEIKGLRKKVLYLLKRSVALYYTTDEDEGDAEERIIKF